MMKKIIPLICSCILLSSCSKVTPVAYTSYKASGEEYVYYSSDMYGVTEGHIMVYENQTKAQESPKNPSIQFMFQRILGADDLNNERFTLVDVTGLYILAITIDKTSSVYKENKKIYLNDNYLEPNRSDSVDYFETNNVIVMRFENFGLKRTNPNGKVDSALVNYFEYRI